MLNLLYTSPIFFLIWIAALLLAITVHEFSHAFAADKLGDPTPRIQGRLTLNPLAHLDPLGTLMLILVRFGWGKPVVFDPYNLQNPRRDSALISLAGPLSNFILAAILSIILRLTAFDILVPFIFLNILLGTFNLIPIHPLDGGKILVGILPPKEAHIVDIFLARNGLYLLLFAILPVWAGRSLISIILDPILDILIPVFIPMGLGFI